MFIDNVFVIFDEETKLCRNNKHVSSTNLCVARSERLSRRVLQSNYFLRYYSFMPRDIVTDTYFNKTFVRTKNMGHTGARNPHYFRAAFKVSFPVSQTVATAPEIEGDDE